jgi:hypothetical protein
VSLYFIVCNTGGQALRISIFEDDSRDEARRIAASIAKLLELWQGAKA